MGKYHMTVTESQNGHITWESQSQHVTKKSADGHEDYGRQDT